MKFKLNTLASIASIALMALVLPAAAQSDAAKDTLTKIRASGKVVLGVRESSSPMASRVRQLRT